MERRIFFLYLLSFLMFGEALSWMMAGGLGPCLIEPEHSQQAANHNEHENCPTFFAGTLLSFERGFEWIKRDDNDKAVVAGFTIVLAVSTIGLWLATNKLWRAGETQRLLAEDTAEHQLRAYVSVESGSNGRQNTKKRVKFEFRPILTNNGLTPAEDVRIISNIGAVPPIIPEDFAYSLPETSNPSVTTIGPRQGRVHTVLYRSQLSFSELRKIVNGEWCFHLYGTVSYRDIFKNRRRTNFSFVIFVPKKSQASYWNYTQYHNDAD